jgi:type I restriction enzyme M protein
MLDAYDVYQHLMDYWAETMQDDVYMIVCDGWKEAAKPRLIVETKEKKTKEKPDFKVGKQKFKADLIPATLLIARYFAEEQAAIDALEAELATLEQQLDDLKEEQGGEGGLLEEVVEGEGEKRKIAAKDVTARLKEIGHHPDYADERKALGDYAGLLDKQEDIKGRLNIAQNKLEAEIVAKYGKLTEAEVKTLVVNDKWLATLAASVQSELDRASLILTDRIRQLSDRYSTTLPKLTEDVKRLAARVDEHLKKMGAQWS